MWTKPSLNRIVDYSKTYDIEIEQLETKVEDGFKLEYLNGYKKETPIYQKINWRFSFLQTRGNACVSPRLYELQEVESLLNCSLHQLLSATGLTIIFLPIFSGVLEERLYLRYVEVFRIYINALELLELVQILYTLNLVTR